MKFAPKLAAVLISASLSAGQLVAADHAAPSVSAAAALAKLKSGNARFVSRAVSAGKPTADRRAATAKTQHPFAIIVGCADSRTSPELIFDQNIGDLFVIRTAGNLVDDYALGSIEYAVTHLGTRLIVVLGHERCGAVEPRWKRQCAGHVGDLVHEIRPAVKAVRVAPATRSKTPLTKMPSVSPPRFIGKPSSAPLPRKSGSSKATTISIPERSPGWPTDFAARLCCRWLAART